MYLQSIAADPFRNAPMKPRDASLQRMIGPSLEQYTKEDAVRTQYFRQYDLTDLHVTIADIQNGYDVSQIHLPSLKQEDIDAYGKKLEAEGLGKDIDWNGVKADFRSVAGADMRTDQFDLQVDYVASRYAVLKSRIENDYTGEDQKAQLATLDAVFTDAKQRLADAYGKNVGSFFEQNGVAGETEHLRNSMVQGIDARVQQYQKTLATNPPNTSDVKTEDAWLLRDDAYMAMRLRESATADTASAPSFATSADAPYTLRDLVVAGVFAQQTTDQYNSLQFGGTTRNEESIGLDLAMQAMKTDYLTQQSGISTSMAQTIKDAFQTYKSRFLDALDENLQRDSGNRASREPYVPLDRQAVDSVFSYTMRRYETTGDILSSLAQGAVYGKQIYDAKSNDDAYAALTRYQEKPLYSWDNFFKPPAQAHYTLHVSDFEKYALGLQLFQNSFNSGKASEMNLMLGQNGNSAADAITVQNYRDSAQTGSFSAKV